MVSTSTGMVTSSERKNLGVPRQAPPLILPLVNGTTRSSIHTLELSNSMVPCNLLNAQLFNNSGGSLSSVQSSDNLFRTQANHALPDWTQNNYFRPSDMGTPSSSIPIENSVDSLVSSRQTSSIDLLGLLHSSGISLPEHSDAFSDFSLLQTKDHLQGGISSSDSIISKNSSLNSGINLLALNNSRLLPNGSGMGLPSLNQLVHSQDNSSQEVNGQIVSGIVSSTSAEDLQFADSIVSVSADLSGLSCLASINADVSQWDALSMMASADALKNNSLASLPNWKSTADALPSQAIDALTSVLNNGSSIPDVNDLLFSQAVDEIHCYKCKFCPSMFISFCREDALSHMATVHEKELFDLERQVLQTGPLPPWNTVPSFNQQPVTKIASHQTSIQISPSSIGPSNDSHLAQQQARNGEGNFVCGKCHQSFVTLPECRQHMSEVHQVKSSRIRLERPSSNNPNTQRNKQKKRSREEKTIEKNSDKTPPTIPAVSSPAKNDQSKSKNKLEQKNGSEAVVTGAKKRKMITPLQKLTRDRMTAHQGSYICEFKGCNVRFKMLDNLEYHCKCHIGGLGNVAPSFACPECGYRSEYWSSMAGHLWRHHVIDLELHACDQCSFRTFSLSKLENLHKRIHREERPYPCDHCAKTFKTSKQLWTHKAFHLDEGQPYQIIQCMICNRRFSDKRMLRFHLDTVHYKKRPFLCHCCGYSASCRSTLKMHLRQHTGEKPFACDSCDYRTADHNSLRRHKMRHSGEKPYKCPYCTYACIQSTTYKAHLRSKHPGQNTGLMFSCEICPFRTIKQDIFQTHVADHKLDERNSVIPVNGEEPFIQATDFLASGRPTLTLVEAVQFSLSHNSNATTEISNKRLNVTKSALNASTQQ